MKLVKHLKLLFNSVFIVAFQKLIARLVYRFNSDVMYASVLTIGQKSPLTGKYIQTHAATLVTRLDDKPSIFKSLIGEIFMSEVEFLNEELEIHLEYGKKD